MYHKILKHVLALLFIAVALVPCYCREEEDDCTLEPDTRTFTGGYASDDCVFRNRFHTFEQGNAYLPLEPGRQVILEGVEDGEFIHLEITVLNETERVDGVKTRVVEEREYIDGELYEVSRNFFAACRRTGDIYYFGEDVDFYEDGEIVDHHGSWRAGIDGAQPGVLLPGSPMVGARYQQEYYAGEAEDRAEIEDIGTWTVEDTTFERVLTVIESSPLDGPCDFSTKYYAPGIGLIADGDVVLVEAGFAFNVAPLSPFKK